MEIGRSRRDQPLAGADILGSPCRLHDVALEPEERRGERPDDLVHVDDASLRDVILDPSSRLIPRARGVRVDAEVAHDRDVRRDRRDKACDENSRDPEAPGDRPDQVRDENGPERAQDDELATPDRPQVGNTGHSPAVVERERERGHGDHPPRRILPSEERGERGDGAESGEEEPDGVRQDARDLHRGLYGHVRLVPIHGGHGVGGDRAPIEYPVGIQDHEDHDRAHDGRDRAHEQGPGALPGPQEPRRGETGTEDEVRDERGAGESQRRTREEPGPRPRTPGGARRREDAENA